MVFILDRTGYLQQAKISMPGATVSLDLLSQGKPAQIISIGGHGTFRRRLLELGIVPGTPIERTGQAPLGDPLMFRVRGATVCLRAADAREIRVAAG